jgi:hypothetical protein
LLGRRSTQAVLAPSGQRRAELEAVDCIVALVYERPRIRLSRDKEALILHSDKTHVAHN